MAILSITASPSGNGQTSSGFAGSNVNLWSAGSGNVQVSVPVGQGSAWVVWQVQVSDLTPGQPVNGVRVAGVNDFTVGGGGGGIVRTAQAYADIQRTFAAFLNANPSGVGVTVPGTGVGQQVDSVVERPGFTTDDLIAGTFFFGFVVNTNSGDPGLGDAIFRTSALNWTIYTGADVPNPPVGTPTGYLITPVSNTSPGVSETDGVFLPVTFVKTAGVGAFINVAWGLPTAFPNPAESKIKFDMNNTQSYTTVLANNEASTGNMSVIPPWATPGQYTLTCNVTGFDGGGTISLSGVLTIKAPGQGGWFFEI